MRYAESLPPGDLSDVVQALWSVEGAVGEQVRIVPDACVDVIALDRHARSVLINGPMPTAEIVTLRSSAVFGVRLVPGTLPRVAGIASLADLRGGEVAVQRAAGTRSAHEELVGWLRGLRRDGVLARHPAVDLVLAGMTAGTTATRARIGPRQLQRLFASYVGLSPRETSAVLRQSVVARSLRAGEPTGLATLAADHGYADQPHMTRSFRRLAGTPPAAFRREIAGDVFVQDEPASRAPESRP